VTSTTHVRARARRRPPVGILPKVAVLAALWLLFSGKLDALHLGFGVLSVGLVVILTRRVRLEDTRVVRSRAPAAMRWGAALRYPFWLLKEVAVANLQMARLILHPRLPIDPVLVRFDSALESALARVVLGNSITLTPGTLTLDIEGREFLVHAITEDSASGTSLGAMQRKVAHVFRDGALEHPQPHLARSIAAALEGPR
jgi:multicomponent Na+:H+ antiporter subunit E